MLRVYFSNRVWNSGSFCTIGTISERRSKLYGTTDWRKTTEGKSNFWMREGPTSTVWPFLLIHQKGSTVCTYLRWIHMYRKYLSYFRVLYYLWAPTVYIKSLQKKLLWHIMPDYRTRIEHPWLAILIPMRWRLILQSLFLRASVF